MGNAKTCLFLIQHGASTAARGAHPARPRRYRRSLCPHTHTRARTPPPPHSTDTAVVVVAAAAWCVALGCANSRRHHEFLMCEFLMCDYSHDMTSRVATTWTHAPCIACAQVAAVTLLAPSCRPARTDPACRPLLRRARRASYVHEDPTGGASASDCPTSRGNTPQPSGRDSTVPFSKAAGSQAHARGGGASARVLMRGLCLALMAG